MWTFEYLKKTNSNLRNNDHITFKFMNTKYFSHSQLWSHSKLEIISSIYLMRYMILCKLNLVSNLFKNQCKFTHNVGTYICIQEFSYTPLGKKTTK